MFLKNYLYFPAQGLLHLMRTKKYLVYEISIFLLAGLFFFLNSSYVSYPDEFVNILAGVFINQGKIPYKDYFDHHMPFAWYLASFFLRYSFGSYVLFRMYWALFQFAGFATLAIWIRKYYRDFYKYFLGFFFLYPLLSVYFWIHLYIADSLASFFFSLIFWILITQTLTKKIHNMALVVAGWLTWALLFSSLTFLYTVLVLYVWQIYLLYQNKYSMKKFIMLMAIPYVLFFLQLLVSGSLYDFYWSNFVYNTKLYISIPNYVKGKFFNPFKFGLTLIFNFYTNYLPLLSKIKHLDLYLPVGTLAGLSTLALLFLLGSANVIEGLFFFLILSFSAPRSNIQTYSETDYQGSMFLVLGLVSAFIVLFILKRRKVMDSLVQDVLRVTRFLICIFLLFTSIFLLANTYNKFFLRYTQQMPSISKTSFLSRFVDEIIDVGDYFWVGPYEPDIEFYVQKGRLPGKYPTLLPQFREDESLKSSFIAQFEKNTPVIIIFKHEASIFGTPSDIFGQFFVTWLNERYTTLEKEKSNILRSPTSITIKSDLYILKSQKEKTLEKLRQGGYIN